MKSVDEEDRAAGIKHMADICVEIGPEAGQDVLTRTAESLYSTQRNYMSMNTACETLPDHLFFGEAPTTRPQDFFSGRASAGSAEKDIISSGTGSVVRVHRFGVMLSVLMDQRTFDHFRAKTLSDLTVQLYGIVSRGIDTVAAALAADNTAHRFFLRGLWGGRGCFT